MKAKKLFANILISAIALGAVKADEMMINGAGASFPAPVYQMWSYLYTKSQKAAKINYQSIGSGAGLNQLKSETIDFAGSDNPLSLEKQKELSLRQFPMLTGGVVVIANIPNVKSGELKLDRNTLANIFLGKIKNWNNAEIAKLNPRLRLPDLPISVVHRSDSSGTTFIFTNYLSKISRDWKENVGEGSSVKWPTGIGGQKNPGVCNNVKKISGSIGYTEYTYALEAKLACASLENAEGKFVKPNLKTFSAAVESASWADAKGFYMVLTNQAGENSYPIMGVTYILFPENCGAEKKSEMFKYFNWCFNSGKTNAEKLGYVPIPESVVKLIRDEIFK